MNQKQKPITLYDNKDKPFVTIIVDKIEVLRELNIPTSIITHHKENRLYDKEMRKCDISKLTNEDKYKYKLWYSEKVKKES